MVHAKFHKPFGVPHSKSGLAELVKFVKEFQDVCVVMEHTGVYYQVVAERLAAAGIRVSA
ncbi:MAG: hypothetical protein LBK41_08390 [Clostridiales bacterium]|nr:hypothetical protein [Clostridiales bacterium]